MNRYDITNPDTGAQFTYTAETPMDSQPEWGQSPQITVTDLTNTKADPRWLALRSRRNELLTACDWTVMPDNQLDANEHAAWEIYRQALRALPETTADPSAPVWPAPPGSV